MKPSFELYNIWFRVEHLIKKFSKKFSSAALKDFAGREFDMPDVRCLLM